MVHKLVGKIIRFGRDADGNVVSAGGLGEGHEIGHRLTDARARLDYAMGTRDQRIAHLNRHRDLLVARLIGGIHAIDQAAGGVICLDLFTARHLKDRQLVRINAIVRAIGLEHVGTSGAERKYRTWVLASQKGKNGAIGPRHVRVHVSQARHKARRQVGKCDQQHAPHTAQGINVCVRTVRHRIAPKQVGHKGQFVRRQARKRNAR